MSNYVDPVVLGRCELVQHYRPLLLEHHRKLIYQAVGTLGDQTDAHFIRALDAYRRQLREITIVYDATGLDFLHIPGTDKRTFRVAGFAIDCIDDLLNLNDNVPHELDLPMQRPEALLQIVDKHGLFYWMGKFIKAHGRFGCVMGAAIGDDAPD